MDGVDGGVVKLADGGFEAHRQARQIFILQGAVQQIENKAIGQRIIAVQAIKCGQGFGIGCRVRGFIGAAQYFQRLQASSSRARKAGFQFGGGRLGKRRCCSGG